MTNLHNYQQLYETIFFIFANKFAATWDYPVQINLPRRGITSLLLGDP